MSLSRSEPSNARIAELFAELADLLEADGADRHRILAYRRAAVTVSGQDAPVATRALDGCATDIPGIGSTLQSKIVELATTGTIAALDRLRARVPPGLAQIARLDGVGATRARALRDALGVDGVEELRAAAAAGRLEGVPGVGARTAASIARQLGVTPGAEPA